MQATYGSVGSFLPGCAGVATSAWQIHHCAMDEWQAVLKEMRPTHQLLVRDVDGTPLSGGKVIFQNASVTIIELRPGENSVVADSRKR